MKKTLKIFLIVFISIIILITITGAFYINNIMQSTNSIKFDKNKIMLTNSEISIFDNNNEPFLNSNIGKEIVELNKIPEHTINAFLSIEDKDFYSHNGLNYKRMAKAMLTNLKSMSFKEGASTISQQLIKNTHLTQDKTLERKIKEIALTKKLEKEFSKDEILECYLNVIYFGEGSYGIQEASKNYFNKNVEDLTISESAVLAGIIKSPKTYSPIYNKENCLKRRNLVLSEMLKDNKISTYEYENAVNEEIKLNLNNKKNQIEKVYFDAAMEEAKEILNLSESDILKSGIQIYTYLDKEIQNNLHNKIVDEKYYLKNNYGNVADSLAIVIDNKTGGIVAFDGKSDYDLSNFNRQPGSAIKPILVYSPALEKGLISPASKINDEVTNFGNYTPNNVGNKCYGYVTIKEAVAKSLNIPAVKVLQYVGINDAIKFAESCGITFSESDNNLAIALGGFTDGITLKQLTNSYLPYSNEGKFIESKFIKKIIGATGNVIYENNTNFKTVMGSDTAYLTHTLLKEGVQKGTSGKLKKLPYEVAGKTGTVAIKGTNNNTDAISVAYTSNHTMGMWFGNYSLKDEYVLNGNNNGGTMATEVIKDVFSELYANNKPKNIEMPNTCEVVKIDALTYKNDNEIKLINNNFYDRYAIEEIFSKRYLPTEESELFKSANINDFNIVVNSNNVTLSFNAEDFYEYDIIRISDGKEEIINHINNKSGIIEYVDEKIKSNTIYEYKIKVYFKDECLNEESKKIKTEKVDYNFDKIFNKNVKNENKTLSWYFN